MKRIFFVDDDPAVLEGLRLSLRRKRSQWEMRFFTEPQTALEAVAQQPPDVVVSDMRMVDMDGAELLSRIAELAPEAVRIAQSGETDEAVAARAVRVACRFLSKRLRHRGARTARSTYCSRRAPIRSTRDRRPSKRSSDWVSCR